MLIFFMSVVNIGSSAFAIYYSKALYPYERGSGISRYYRFFKFDVLLVVFVNFMNNFYM